MAILQWGALTAEDREAVRELAQICLDRDGGLPQLVEDSFIDKYFFGDDTIAARDDLGDLVAVASLTYDEAGNRLASGLVHPSMRRQGIGEQLVAWGRRESQGLPMRIVAESMSAEAESLFASSGFTRTFAEYVMVHDLTHISRVLLPEGVETEPYTDERARDFYVAYRGSFGDRPGFPDPGEEEFLGFLTDDPDFRPDDSRVAYSRGGAPIGFVTVSGDWIDQVGVVPTWRGHRLGAHLVVRTLTALKAAGSKQVWLNVGVDNPSWELYRRLGFEVFGTRARYADRITAAATTAAEDVSDPPATTD